MNWDLIIKILGSIIGFIGAIYQIRQFNPVKRTRLKHDIEILDKLEKDSESYLSVRAHIDKSIRELYSTKHSNKIIQNPVDFIFGVLFLVVFSTWSVYLYNNHQGFSWWILLTSFFALAGFGGILNGLEKKENKAK